MLIVDTKVCNYHNVDNLFLGVKSHVHNYSEFRYARIQYKLIWNALYVVNVGTRTIIQTCACTSLGSINYIAYVVKKPVKFYFIVCLLHALYTGIVLHFLCLSCTPSLCSWGSLSTTDRQVDLGISGGMAAPQG